MTIFTKKSVKLRTMLLGWFGGIFIFFFLATLVLEDLLVKRDLEQAQNKLTKSVFSEEVIKETTKVVRHVSWSMRASAALGLFIALVFLGNITKRVSKPIAELAEEAKEIGEGKFNEAELPQPKGQQPEEIALLLESFGQMLQGLKEREKVRGVLNKVVSKDIAQEIMKGQVHLGGEEKSVAIFFADIRGFTKMTEHMKPAEVIDMLNSCMTRITHIIDEHGGVIDKYIGDAAMALFGAPVAHEENSLRAIKSALEIQRSINEWNEERKNEGKEPIEMGIGINTGNVLVGNMGAENRLNYTALGSNVNLASRLCSIAQKGEVIISESVFQDPKVKGAIKVDAKEAVSLKGFTDPIKTYSVLDLQNPSA